MSDAKKLPSGKWRNLLYVGKDANGKRIYESFTADTKKEANLLAMSRAREIEQGIMKDRTPSELTVGEAIDRYIEDRDAILKPKTIREYVCYRKHYLQGLMDIKIKKLTEDMVQREINKAARTLAPKSVRNAWSLVQSSLKAAVPELNYRIILPRKEKKEIRIPTNAELLQIFEKAEGMKVEIPVLLGATCGLRRGEIAAIDLSTDVNYENCTISINKAYSRNKEGQWVLGDTKTYDSTRVVEVPAWVAEKLAAARDAGYENMTPDAISNGFTYICKKLGIKVRFHDLRHYYASLMLSLNVPDKYAMKRMGHATPNMLKNVYQHLMDEKDAEVSQVMNQYFESMQHGVQHSKGLCEEKERKMHE